MFNLYTAISIPQFINSRKQEYTTLINDKLVNDNTITDYTNTVSLENDFKKIMTPYSIAKSYIGVLLSYVPKILREGDSYCAGTWCPDLYWDGSHGIASLIKYFKFLS